MKNKELIHDLKHSFQSLAKILIPVGTAVLTGNPIFAVGASSFFLETFFGIRSRLKIERIESFLESLEKDVEKLNLDQESDSHVISQNLDLFENVLIQAAKTQDELKLRAYRKILLGHIKKEISIDQAETYTKLIGDLTTSEVIFLQHFYQYEQALRQKRNSGDNSKDPITESLKAMHTLDELKQIVDEKRAEFYNRLSEGEMQFITSSLVSHGLLIQNSSGGGSWRRNAIFDSMVLSTFAKDIVNFIKNN